MYQVYKSEISLAFNVAMVTKMASKICWISKLTIIKEQI